MTETHYSQTFVVRACFIISHSVGVPGELKLHITLAVVEDLAQVKSAVEKS